MLKVYKSEQALLKNYWEDLKAQVSPQRQTTLGNFILSVLTLLPTLRDRFNSNQAEMLQILAHFSNLGHEARVFLLEARTLERLLNFFHWDSSPYFKNFMEEKKLPFDINLVPEIGLPTPEDANDSKKSGFALLKEKQRLAKLRTDWPKYHFLILTLSNLARSIHLPVRSPHALEDSGFELTE